MKPDHSGTQEENFIAEIAEITEHFWICISAFSASSPIDNQMRGAPLPASRFNPARCG